MRKHQGKHEVGTGCFLANNDIPFYLRFCRISILMDPLFTVIPHFVNLVIRFDSAYVIYFVCLVYIREIHLPASTYCG